MNGLITGHAVEGDREMYKIMSETFRHSSDWGVWGGVAFFRCTDLKQYFS